MNLYTKVNFSSLFLQDNLSRGNIGAIKVLQEQFPEPGRLQFILADLGDAKTVSYHIFYSKTNEILNHESSCNTLVDSLTRT